MKRLILFIAVLSLSFGFAEAQSARKLLLSQSSTPLANSKYGLLYNWDAASDSRGFVSGWHLPTDTDFDALATYLGGSGVAGGKLKETGLVYWNSPNTGATNETGFYGRSSGSRDDLGEFYSVGLDVYFWISDVYFGVAGRTRNLYYNSGDLVDTNGGFDFIYGATIRLIKDDSTNPGFVDIDGKRYNTVTIGSQVWMSENLQAKHYANGDAIPEEQDNTLWASRGTLGEGLWCVYGNDDSNR